MVQKKVKQYNKIGYYQLKNLHDLLNKLNLFNEMGEYFFFSNHLLICLAEDYVVTWMWHIFLFTLVEILLLNSFSIIEFLYFGQAFWNLFQKRKY